MIEPCKTLCLCASDLFLSSQYATSIEILIKKAPRLVQSSTHEPPLFIFYGHGNDTMMIGQDRKSAIDSENAHLLRGWVVYAMACNTANVLGPAIIKAGGLAYIGFSKHFKFIPYASGVFGQCVNNVAKEIMNGRNLGDVLKLTRGKFDHYIKKYKRKYNGTDDTELRKIFRKTCELLIHDKSCLTLLGDPKITLKS